MSIFSSLSYLLKKAYVAIQQTTSAVPTFNLLPVVDSKPRENVSRIFGSESSSMNSTSYDTYLNFTLATNGFTCSADINSLFDNSLIKLSNSLPTSISKTFLNTENAYNTESDVQFHNNTYQNADLLHENWWNVFDERYLRHAWGLTIFLIIAYMIIFVLGVIGNLMVILVVSLRPQMRTVTNMFITNLAVADLFVVVFCVPSTLLANIFAPWILGSFMCKSLAYVQGVSVCASAYSLAAISLDRCQAIYRNLERPRGFSRTTGVIIVFMIWIAAVSLTIPWAIMFNVKISEFDGLRYCTETWEVQNQGNIYFIVVTLFCFYFIPFFLIFFSNGIIYFQVRHREVPEDSTISSAPIRKMHRQTRNDVLRMLGIVTFTFLFSWLPLYTLMTIIKFAKNITEWEYTVLGVLMPIAQWLGSWNSSINPVLYAFLNKKFRQMLKSILPEWIPVNLTGKKLGATKRPGYIAATPTVRRFARNRSYNSSGYRKQHTNDEPSSQNQIFLLKTRFRELMGTVATRKIQTLSTSSLTTRVISSFKKEYIFETAVAKFSKNEIITDV